MRGRWSPRRHDVQLIRVIGKFKKKKRCLSRDESHARNNSAGLILIPPDLHTHVQKWDARIHMPTTHTVRPSCGMDVQAENQTAGQFPGKPLRLKCFQAAGFGFITTDVYFLRGPSSGHTGAEKMSWNVLKTKKVQLSLLQVDPFISGKKTARSSVRGEKQIMRQ